MSEFIFHLRASRYALYFYSFFSMIWLMVLLFLDMSLYWVLAFALLAFAYFILHIRGSASAQTLIYQMPFFSLGRAPGQTYFCESSFVSSWILILYLRNTGSQKKKFILVFKDALATLDYQRLHILLKYRLLQRKDRFNQSVEIR